MGNLTSNVIALLVFFNVSVGLSKGAPLTTENLSDFNDLGGRVQVKHLERKRPGISDAISKMATNHSGKYRNSNQQKHSSTNFKRVVDDLYVGHQPSTNTLVFYCKGYYCENQNIVATTSSKILMQTSPSAIEEFISHFRFYTDLQALTMLVPKTHPDLEFLYGVEVGRQQAGFSSFFIEGGRVKEADTVSFSPEVISKSFSVGVKRSFENGVRASIGITRVNDSIMNYTDEAVLATIEIKR